MWETYRVLFDVFNFQNGVSMLAVGLLATLMSLMLFVCVYTDLKSMIIPDVITYPGIFLSAVLAPLLWANYGVNYAVAIVCFVFFMIMANVKIRGQYAFGYGDVKLYIWFGLVFAQAVLPIMILASLIGIAQELVLRLFRGKRVVPHAAAGVEAQTAAERMQAAKAAGETVEESDEPQSAWAVSADHFPHGPHMILAAFIVAVICAFVS
jgi:Flp pilus assembly protein protease CpaA